MVSFGDLALIVALSKVNDSQIRSKKQKVTKASTHKP